jgi:uncharacterized membrane protein YraQ (UPF0718 family)
MTTAASARTKSAIGRILGNNFQIQAGRGENMRKNKKNYSREPRHLHRLLITGIAILGVFTAVLIKSSFYGT